MEQQAGPSPRFSSRGGHKPKGGAKNQKGGHILKYSIGCMQQQGGQTRNGGKPISKGGPGTTAPPAGDGPDHKLEMRFCLNLKATPMTSTGGIV